MVAQEASTHGIHSVNPYVMDVKSELRGPFDNIVGRVSARVAIREMQTSASEFPSVEAYAVAVAERATRLAHNLNEIIHTPSDEWPLNEPSYESVSEVLPGIWHPYDEVDNSQGEVVDG
jgi:hypothetical protein